MRSTILASLLAIAFLGAGAFARTRLPDAPKNITVVFKNSAMPLKGQLAIAPCETRHCLAI